MKPDGYVCEYYLNHSIGFAACVQPVSQIEWLWLCLATNNFLDMWRSVLLISNTDERTVDVFGR